MSEARKLDFCNRYLNNNLTESEYHGILEKFNSWDNEDEPIEYDLFYKLVYCFIRFFLSDGVSTIDSSIDKDTVIERLYTYEHTANFVADVLVTGDYKEYI